MRISSSSIPRLEESRVDQNQSSPAQPVENNLQRAVLPNTSTNAALRRAETGISSNLRESELRGTAPRSLDSILNNLPDALAHSSKSSTKGVNGIATTVTGSATPSAPIKDFQTTTSTIN